jgi:hypothetical protein
MLAWLWLWALQCLQQGLLLLLLHDACVAVELPAQLLLPPAG